ncbi:glycosyltransferase family 2 protein [Aeromonas sp. QDB59]|uniref:glycosyltransferase family 2 protein n=1 Tax=Aeromonas sp. QDB59 TaxID=2990497 RepID=UPI0022E3783A|nr:glycosyltransferase family 2 protein [Aeromonas sp. QDB59]
MQLIFNFFGWLMPLIRPKLKPKKDLLRREEHWAALSEDPFFELSPTVMKLCGWYMLNIKMTLSSATAIAKIYFDKGNGYNETDQVTIRLNSGGLKKRIIYLKYPPKKIRFDPCEAPLEFNIEEFSFSKLTASKAKNLMLKKLNEKWQGEQIKGLYKKYCEYLDENLSPVSYQHWLEKHDLSINVGESHSVEIKCNPHNPKFSLLLATYNSDIGFLSSCIESVIHQSYPDWQLCIADDGSANVEVHKLLEYYHNLDSRISLIKRDENGHISQASNSALSLAKGQYIALIDHDDLLPPYALQMMAKEIDSHKSAQFFYSDEDKIDENGLRFSPHFKPDWNRDLFYSHNYITHFAVIKKSLVDLIGGFNEGVEGSQDYDLFLRAISHLDDCEIIHIPHILYHWRAISGSTALSSAEKDYTSRAGLKALQNYFSKINTDVVVMPHNLNNCYRVFWPIPNPAPLVSLIIPTRDHLELLGRCVKTILECTSYRFFEIIIVNNQSSCLKTIGYLERIKKIEQVRVINYDHPFNFSAINNFAVSHARGSIIGLINNDIEVLSADWLEEMVRQVCRPDIGCVGAKLYYPDMRIQHAGVVLGIGGVAGHSHKFFRQHHHGYHSRLSLVQNYSAVTAATLLVRKSVYDEVGGMETSLSVAFNDVDFCLKVLDAGYRNLWTPFAELIHHESVSRGYEDNPEKQARFRREVDYMKNKWGHRLNNDPCYNVNLSLTHENFSYRV